MKKIVLQIADEFSVHVGTVSNVAQFGAFVDLGVHQDGLVHVSQLANRFVQDAREVVKTGDVVKVRVLEVDLARKRISLSMKLDADPGKGAAREEGNRFQPAARDERARRHPSGPADRHASGTPEPAAQGAMAAAFAKLQQGR